MTCMGLYVGRKEKKFRVKRKIYEDNNLEVKEKAYEEHYFSGTD